MTKKRLDKAVQELFPDLTRNQIQSFIMQGKVKVDGKVITKSGQAIDSTLQVILDQEVPKYVCRAGFKLEKALELFDVHVAGKVALDAGLSTGGFTDCLLQNGIKKVYGVDVGYGQVHEKIKNNEKVCVMERTNLRHLEKLDELVNLITLDLSFISVLKVIDVVKALLKEKGDLIVLIKPQFEAERHQVKKGGIVKDEKVHQQVIQKVTEGIKQAGFTFQQIIESPITGTHGNKEFLAHFTLK